MPLFAIRLYKVKTLKMGFFKNGSIIFFLFLDLRSTQTNTENGQSSFPWTFFVSKPQSKIGVDRLKLFSFSFVLSIEKALGFPKRYYLEGRKGPKSMLFNIVG